MRHADSYSMLYGSYIVLLLYTGLRSVSKLLVKLAFSVDGKRSSRRCNVKLYRKARSSTKPRASESAIWCPNVGTLPIRTCRTGMSRLSIWIFVVFFFVFFPDCWILHAIDTIYSKRERQGAEWKMEKTVAFFVDGAGLMLARDSFVYAYYGRGVRNIYGLFTLEAHLAAPAFLGYRPRKNKICTRKYNKIKRISCRHFCCL